MHDVRRGARRPRIVPIADPDRTRAEIDALYRALEHARSQVVKLENDIAERQHSLTMHEQRQVWWRQNARILQQRAAGVGAEVVR